MGGTAGWVADNLAVIDWALNTAHEPLTVELLNAWHRQLMQHGTLPPDLVGVFRPSLGWVGGQTSRNAAYVPPPPSAISDLMDDLITFADREPQELDPVSHAAIIHAQFEAIHPYGDGNGRLGRALISRTLRRLGVANRSTAPMSMAIARDPGGYLAGLRFFELGSLDQWVRWFAETAEKAASTTMETIEETEALLSRWAEATAGLRADHSARALLPRLPAHPLISAADVAELLGVSERTAHGALTALVDRGILAPINVAARSPGRNRRWFIAPDLLDHGRPRVTAPKGRWGPRDRVDP
ncbi:Fic family protein [Candidatus Poriferisocius sp.]|uniref:Fic family protein n=1 Tax=Candidatus Poriferisocius sp. TaxID=3101276 RepID=UPI003B5CB7D0